jgi:hypothetical protein
MRTLHLADANARDAFVRFVSVKEQLPPQKVVNGRPVSMRRFLASGEANTHDALEAVYGSELAQTLINADPDVDLELVGRPIERTRTVYLDSDREVLRFAPDVVELLLDPFGQEKERRSPEDRPPNVSEEVPVRFTKNRIKRLDAVRRFVFNRTLQLWHTDGLTYEFLHGIATELDKADEMVLLGAGIKARDPLVLQLNGLPWRAFLEGRVNDTGYCLMLRLSNLELKTPPERS